MFNVEGRILVENLYKMKDYSAKIRKFPDKGWDVNGLSYLLKKLRDTGTTARKRQPGSVRRQSARTVNKNLAIANRSRVSCINTNRSHNLATSGESRRYVVAFTRVAGRGIWLRQDSLRHILASLGYAHGTIAVNVTWMERGFKLVKSIAACTHLSSTVFQ